MIPGTPESERARTILLVEDEPLTRSFIQRFLERDGHNVIAVDAAEEGIVESGETPPDVLIADIHLPGLSGIELASFLLAQDPGLAVILMTGDPDEELARRAMGCGPVQYVLKPFEWFEMQAAVRFALSQRDAATGPGLGELLERDYGSGAGAPLHDFGSEAGSHEEPAPEYGDDTAGESDFEPGAEVLSCAESEVASDARAEDIAGPEFEPGAEAEVDPAAGANVEYSFAEGHGGSFHADGELLPGFEDAVVLELDEDAVVPYADEADVEAGHPDEWLERADRDSFAGPGHGDRVARIALALLADMAEPVAVQASDLALAARVHEVGRLQLPDGDPVDVAARGAEILADTGFPAAVTQAIRHMHERWDGASGPEGLSGTRIPAGARVLAVADAIDHYASAWIRSGLEPELSAEKAMHLVTVQQNRAFGPAVVGAMHRASDTLLRICAQDRLRESAQSVPVPAMAAAESVPFALFASE